MVFYLRFCFVWITKVYYFATRVLMRSEHTAILFRDQNNFNNEILIYLTEDLKTTGYTHYDTNGVANITDASGISFWCPLPANT